MSQTITLTLPDKLYGPIQRIAEATDTTVEAVLLTALQASLPSLDGLSSELAQELFELEALDNEALRQIILETVPLDQQQEMVVHYDRLNEIFELNWKRMPAYTTIRDIIQGTSGAQLEQSFRQ